jgi:hypothetical protein
VVVVNAQLVRPVCAAIASRRGLPTDGALSSLLDDQGVELFWLNTISIAHSPHPIFFGRGFSIESSSVPRFAVV